jgi:hypothetical protein
MNSLQRITSAVITVSAALAVAACSTSIEASSLSVSAFPPKAAHSPAAATPSSQRPTPTEAAATTAVPASAAASTGASPGANLRVQLLGFPASITLGSHASQVVMFNVILTNNGSTPLSDVGALFQLVGGPCNCVLGSLKELDNPATGTWYQVPMPEGDGDPNYLARATGARTIAPGQSTVVDYWLTLSAQNPAKAVTAIFYAVQQPNATTLATATVPSQLIAG